jgi:predicted nucleic acid-binding protein
MPLGGSLEDNTLTALVWNERLAPQIALKAEARDFSTDTFRRIATAALDFLERHHRPARAHIGDILEHDIRRGVNGRFMLEVINEMERLAPLLNEEHVIGELDKFLEIQKLTKAVNQASDLLLNGDLEQAREILRAPQLLPRDKPGTWLSDTAGWFSFMRKEGDKDRFSTGIDVLDERGIRPARGELFVLLAASGRGKSWFLVNAGKHNVANRKNVLHLTLENTLDMTLQRYTQCLLSLTQDESKSVSVTIFIRPEDGYGSSATKHDNPQVESLHSIGIDELKERIAPFQQRGKLLVKHFPSGLLTYGQLVAYLDSLELVHDFKPDLVILDYLTLMDVSTRDLRVNLGKLTQNLRGLASLRDFALLTVAQGNRLSKDARLVTSNHIAEDWSIVATSDTFITYSQTIDEKNKGVARILVDKSRKSGDKWLASITQAYDMGQFCLDSEYMNKYLETEIAQYVEPVDDR